MEGRYIVKRIAIPGKLERVEIKDVCATDWLFEAGDICLLLNQHAVDSVCFDFVRCDSRVNEHYDRIPHHLNGFNANSPVVDCNRYYDYMVVVDELSDQELI